MTCSLVTPGNQSTKSSTLAPASMFSKSAVTGTRVPRNTQAPLTRSGAHSTAKHVVQSNIVKTLGLRHDCGNHPLAAAAPPRLPMRRAGGGSATNTASFVALVGAAS